MMSGLVVDPRMAREEVQEPVVHWQGAEAVGTETWQGSMTVGSTVPQVELRRTLDSGVSVTVRVNIGSLATGSKGNEVPGGIAFTSNKFPPMTVKEWFSLAVAVDEAFVRLSAEQEAIYARLGQRLMGRDVNDEPSVLE